VFSIQVIEINVAIWVNKNIASRSKKRTKDNRDAQNMEENTIIFYQ
jgi:hypothetical protein